MTRLSASKRAACGAAPRARSEGEEMKRMIGLLVKPVAGMGGSVGLNILVVAVPAGVKGQHITASFPHY